MSYKYDIGLKKSVHFNLTKDGHRAFRVACINRGLSMQEVIEEFVQRILIENNHIIKNNFYLFMVAILVVKQV